MKYFGIVIGFLLFLALVLSTRAGWDASWSNLNAYGFIEPVHMSNLVDAVNERSDLLVQRAYPYAYPAAVTAHIAYVECSSTSTGRYPCSVTVTNIGTNTYSYTNFCLGWTTNCITNEVKNDFIQGELLKTIDTKIFQLIPYFVNQELEGTNHYSAWLSLTNTDFPYYTATGLFETVGIMQSGKLYDVQSTGRYPCSTTTTNIGTNTYVYTNYCLGYVTNVITNAYFHDTGTDGTVYDFVSASNLLERYLVLNKLAWVSGDRLCIKDVTRGEGTVDDSDCQSSLNGFNVDVCDSFVLPEVDDWENYGEYAIQDIIGAGGWTFVGGHYLAQAVMTFGHEGCDQGFGFVWRETGNTVIGRESGRPITQFATSKTCDAEFYLLAPKIENACIINVSNYNESRENFYQYYSGSEETISLDEDYDNYVYYWPDSAHVSVLTLLEVNAIKHNAGLEDYSFDESCKSCENENDNQQAVWEVNVEAHPIWSSNCVALAKSEFNYDCIKVDPGWMDENIFLLDDRNTISFSEGTANRFMSLIKYTPEFHE
jgi:hypothetical protein